MSTSPLNLELDVLSAALAKLGIDVPASEVLEAIKEELDKIHAEQPKSMFFVIIFSDRAESNVFFIRAFGRSTYTLPWTREADNQKIYPGR